MPSSLARRILNLCSGSQKRSDSPLNDRHPTSIAWLGLDLDEKIDTGKEPVIPPSDRFALSSSLGHIDASVLRITTIR